MRRWLLGLLVAGSVAGSAIVVASPWTGGGVAPAACASATPYAPDSDDLWGGCWPGPQTVGIPAGTSLTDYTGSCTITTPDVVIDAKTFNCRVFIEAANVQITRSKINGGVMIDVDTWPNAYSFSVRDSEIDVLSDSVSIYSIQAGIGKSNFVGERNYIHGGIRGAWCEYNCTVRDTYICCQANDDRGSLTCTDPDGGQHHCIHESGIRMGSGPAGSGQVIEHNVIACDALNWPDPVAGGTDSAGCSATLTGYGDFAPIQNNTVNRNLFMPTEGGTCAYGGATVGSPVKQYGGDSNHIVFTDNVFVSRPDVPRCGWYFTSADYDAARPGNVWTGNQRWTGSALVTQPPNQ